MPAEPNPIDLLKLHTDEVRFQVQLNWDRAKSSLTFHLAVLAGAAALEKVIARNFVVALLFFVALSALLSIRIISVGHAYYRAARNRRAAIEAAMGLDVRFGSTPGQRDEPRSWPNMTQVLISQHALLAALALGGALYLMSR